jgi:hypothetical protein
MYYYLYGTKHQQHIEHMLVTSKNVQLTSDQVKLTLASGAISEADLASGLVVRMDKLRESVVLPVLPPHTPACFQSGTTHKISIFRDTNLNGPGLARSFDDAAAIASGTLTLGAMVYADSVLLNSDPVPSGTPVKAKTDVSRMTLQERLDATRHKFEPELPKLLDANDGHLITKRKPLSSKTLVTLAPLAAPSSYVWVFYAHMAAFGCLLLFVASGAWFSDILAMQSHHLAQLETALRLAWHLGH